MVGISNLLTDFGVSNKGAPYPMPTDLKDFTHQDIASNQRLLQAYEQTASMPDIKRMELQTWATSLRSAFVVNAELKAGANETGVPAWTVEQLVDSIKAFSGQNLRDDYHSYRDVSGEGSFFRIRESVLKKRIAEYEAESNAEASPRGGVHPTTPDPKNAYFRRNDLFLRWWGDFLTSSVAHFTLPDGFLAHGINANSSENSALLKTPSDCVHGKPECIRQEVSFMRGNKDGLGRPVALEAKNSVDAICEEKNPRLMGRLLTGNGLSAYKYIETRGGPKAAHAEKRHLGCSHVRKHASVRLGHTPHDVPWTSSAGIGGSNVYFPFTVGGQGFPIFIILHVLSQWRDRWSRLVEFVGEAGPDEAELRKINRAKDYGTMTVRLLDRCRWSYMLFSENGVDIPCTQNLGPPVMVHKADASILDYLKDAASRKLGFHR